MARQIFHPTPEGAPSYVHHILNYLDSTPDFTDRDDDDFESELCTLVMFLMVHYTKPKRAVQLLLIMAEGTVKLFGKLPNKD